MNEFEIVTLIERPVKEVFAVLEDVTKPGHTKQFESSSTLIL